MSYRSYLIAGAAALGMALPTMAGAQTIAQVTTDLNLRAGPGTNHGVITSMPRGAQVQVHQCPSNWCQVSYGGTTGWASHNYLSTGVAAQPRTRTYSSAQPRVRFGFDVGPRYRDYGPRYRYGSRYDRRYGPRFDRRYYRGDRYHRRGSGFSFSFGG